MNLWGTYAGTVVSSEDPLQLGRLRVRVPHVYGPGGGSQSLVGNQELPWAMPAGMPAGQTQESGGVMWLPEPGDHVWVRFLDGEPEKPVWEWGMQDFQGNKNYQFILYKKATAATPSTQGNQGQKGQPPLKKSRLTRYGHLYEWNPFGMIASTAKGYATIFTDASATQLDGSLVSITARGYFTELDDLTESLLDYCGFYTGTFLFNHTTQAQDFYFKSVSLSGAATNVNLSGITTLQAASLTAVTYTHVLDGDKIILGKFNLPPTLPTPVGGPPPPRPPPLPLDPLVRLSDLQLYSDKLSLWLDALELWLLTHTHTNGNLGAPTGPPVLPPFPPANQPASIYLLGQQVPTGSPAVLAVKNAPAP